MERFFKYILLVSIVSLYLTPILELDSKECKQNYEKEIHSFICTDSHSHQFSSFEVKNDLPSYIFSCCLAKEVTQQTSTNLLATKLHPPERLYLHYSVFLI